MCDNERGRQEKEQGVHEKVLSEAGFVSLW